MNGFNNNMREMSKAILSLIDASKNAISALNHDEILSHIIDILPSIIDADAAYIRILDKRSPRLLAIEASSGLTPSVIDKIRYQSIGEGGEGITAKGRSHIMIKDLSVDLRLQHAKELVRAKLRSTLCVPILFDNETYGTITVLSKEVNNYSENDIYMLLSFSNIVGIAFKNASLYKNLKMSYLNTINSLVLIMESRDPYMRGHSERVTDVAIGIARRMRMPDSDLQILRTAGKLHDIGKITISDSILSKPDRLSPSEWAEIHLHPIRGVEIVSPLKFLDSGLALIRNHHEKYDGSGYPDGIAGESIPILARVLTVADSFDAMTSKRPYRAPLSTEAAMAEIRANAGTQFDPVLAGVFVDVMNR